MVCSCSAPDVPNTALTTLLRVSVIYVLVVHIILLMNVLHVTLHREFTPRAHSLIGHGLQVVFRMQLPPQPTYPSNPLCRTVTARSGGLSTTTIGKESPTQGNVCPIKSRFAYQRKFLLSCGGYWQLIRWQRCGLKKKMRRLKREKGKKKRKMKVKELKVTQNLNNINRRKVLFTISSACLYYCQLVWPASFKCYI